MRLRKPELKKARIEIIPMIDTIFFLLVFFMITSLSMIQMKGMGVSLPKASGPNTGPPPPRVVVTVDKAGDFYLNIDKIDPANLVGSLQTLVRSKPDTVIVVNIDKGQNVQTLVTVMDAVNQVKKPSGEPAPVMIASQQVDLRGLALPTTSGKP